MTSVGVAGRVGVVFEEEYLTVDPFLPESFLRGSKQLLEDPLPCLVVGDHIVHRVTFGRGVLGVGTDVQVEACTVDEKYVRASPPVDDLSEKVSGYLIWAETTLAIEGAGDAKLVLYSIDATLHRPPTVSRGERPTPHPLCA